MDSRIRYRKHRDGILRSIKTYTSSSTNAKYIIKLYPEEVRATIYNINSERIVYTADGVKTMQALKAKVKRKLKKLGVKFDSEIRRYEETNRIEDDDLLSELSAIRELVRDSE